MAPFSHKTRAEERSGNLFSHRHRLKLQLAALCSISNNSSNSLSQQVFSPKIQPKFLVSSPSLPTNRVIGHRQRKNLKSFKLLPLPTFSPNFRIPKTSTHQHKPTQMKEVWQRRRAATIRVVSRPQHRSTTQVNVIVCHTWRKPQLTNNWRHRSMNSSSWSRRGLGLQSFRQLSHLKSYLPLPTLSRTRGQHWLNSRALTNRPTQTQLSSPLRRQINLWTKSNLMGCKSWECPAISPSKLRKA